MESYLKVAVRGRRNARVLVVEGELDRSSSPYLQETLERLELPGPELILDLRGLTFMDLSGLRVLLRAYERARAAGIRLVLLNVGGGVRRLITLTGTTELLASARGE